MIYEKSVSQKECTLKISNCLLINVYDTDNVGSICILSSQIIIMTSPYHNNYRISCHEKSCHEMSLSRKVSSRNVRHEMSRHEKSCHEKSVSHHNNTTLPPRINPLSSTMIKINTSI